MSYFTTKLILGSLFLLSGIAATISMLAVMGRAEKKMSAITLKRLHKITGFIFFILLLILSAMGSLFWANAGDEISTRAVLHAVLAGGLFILFILKILIVKFYKQFLRMAPTLGMTVFGLAFVVFFISGGYYSMRLLDPPEAPESQVQTLKSEIMGRVHFGKRIFDAKCASCHWVDSEEKKTGPSLQDILKKKTLPHSGRPATIKNILAQLERPVLAMPAFKNLTEQELADLMAYMKTI